MPYIKNRKFYEKEAIALGESIANIGGAGELNYVISKILHTFIERKELRYDNINLVIGVLACCQAELYRQIAAPYESKKKIQNGSVSELDARNLEDVR